MILPEINFNQVQYVYFRKMGFEYVPGKYPPYDCFFQAISGAEYEEYNPFEITDLYERFSNLDETNPKRLLEFINEYGPIKINLDKCPPMPYTEHIKDWRDEIRQMRKAVLMKKLYLSKNIILTAKTLKNKLKEFKDDDTCQYLIETVTETNKIMQEQKEYDFKMACLLKIQQIFNEPNHLGEISLAPYLDVRADNTPCFVSILKFKSLLSVMYWQLYLLFFENKPVFTCENCKGPFEWKEKDKIFLCEECQKKNKYKKRSADPKLKAHDQFARRIAYHARGKEAWSLREEIMKESLKKAKNKKIPEKEYKNWLSEQNDIFMAKIKNIRN